MRRCQLMDEVVAKPELSIEVAEAVLVVRPLSGEILLRFPEVSPPLNDLGEKKSSDDANDLSGSPRKLP